jgi:hypothetical protein
MPSPGVSLSGKIRDISGNPIAGIVTAVLGNYGGNAPIIVGDSELAPISLFTTANGSGIWSLTLWGSDQIYPPFTTYTISITPANSNVAIWIAEYLIKSGSYDLSNLAPLVVTPPAYIQPVAGLGGLIAATQVAFGSGTNTIGGDSQFLWDSVNHKFHVGVSDTDPSLNTAASFWLPNRNEIVAVSPGRLVDTTGHNAMTVYGQDGPFAAVQGINVTKTNTGSFLTTGGNFIGWIDGITSGFPVEGDFAQGFAVNSSNLTGDTVGEFGYCAGIRTEAQVWSGSHVDWAYGAIVVPNIQDSGSTVTNMIGVRAVPRSSGSGGAVTNAVGFRSEGFQNTGSATLVNNYGFYAVANGAGSTFNAAFYSENQGTGANNYAIYVAGGKTFLGGTLNGLTLPSASGSAGLTQTIASGSTALGTTLIASGAKSSILTVTATGVLATDNILADFNTDPSGITGYAPSASGMLTIIKWCSAGAINFYQYNNSGAGITPGAVTLNWRVCR